MTWKTMSRFQKFLLVTAFIGVAVYFVLTVLHLFDVMTGFDTLRFAAFGMCWLAMAILEQNKALKITHGIVAGLWLFSCLLSLILG